MKTAEEAIVRHGVFILGVSGGSMAALLASLSLDTDSLAKWHLFLVDERAVPLDHVDSNYREISETWGESRRCIWHPAVFSETIAERDALLAAADAYETVVRRVFADTHSTAFDLVLLGLGPDGHTASLFPDHPDFMSNRDTDRIVIAVSDSPKPPACRISLSPQAIACARAAAFIVVGGAAKAPVVAAIVRDRNAHFPPTTVAPHAHWFLDAQTASLL